jgi:cob(I)alamin adenosyltransferase
LDPLRRKVGEMKGYVQVYTGDGKGKTSAALGLALRASGAGLKVFFAQFAKGQKSSEFTALERLSEYITVRQYGSDSFIIGVPGEEDIRAAQKGLIEVREAMLSGLYQVIIMDEANVAVHYNLISLQAFLDLISAKPDYMELVITGRDADPRIIAAADLVTEMMEIKHYYNDGVTARVGIEK